MQGRVTVDGTLTRDPSVKISPMMRIQLDDQQLQGTEPRYYMVHKPIGVVSATTDEKHPTVLSLLPESLQEGLHLAGRLDLNTTGLMLLTNDGRWSRRVTQPTAKHPKVYHVRTEDPISVEYQDVFHQGIYFAYEDLTTLPAELEILDTREARLTLYEGRYHQVKRMFGYFDNKVVGLHRERIGEVRLDSAVTSGNYRALEAAEINAFNEISTS